MRWTEKGKALYCLEKWEQGYIIMDANPEVYFFNDLFIWQQLFMGTGWNWIVIFISLQLILISQTVDCVLTQNGKNEVGSE